MAFRTVSGGGSGLECNTDGVALTSLAVGDSITGFVEGFFEGKYSKQAREKDPTAKPKMSLIMRSQDGSQRFAVHSAGNIPYDINDGKIQIGQLVQITRVEDGKSGGMKSSKYTVGIDDEVTLETATLAELGPDTRTKKPETAGKSNVGAANRAAATASIKAHADRMRAAGKQ